MDIRSQVQVYFEEFFQPTLVPYQVESLQEKLLGILLNVDQRLTAKRDLPISEKRKVQFVCLLCKVDKKAKCFLNSVSPVLHSSDTALSLSDVQQFHRNHGTDGQKERHHGQNEDHPHPQVIFSVSKNLRFRVVTNEDITNKDLFFAQNLPE